MKDVYVAPLLFSWPRSGTPTFFILESPLGLPYVLGSIRFSTAINIPHFSVRLLCTWA